jgi:hypothetical protein
MKFAIVFLALVGYAYGGYVEGLVGPAVGVVNTGASAQFRSQDNIGNYAFGYNEDHSTGGTFRRESGAPGVQVGSYGLRDIDGRVRVVNYVADAGGFRANIQTNEPGVEPKDPAAVLINKAAAIVAAAPVAAPVVAHAYAAPAIAHSYAAPIAYAPRVASSYSVSTQHVAGAPAVVSYAAPAVVAAAPAVVSHSYAAPLAAPFAYGTKTIAAPIAQYAGW